MRGQGYDNDANMKGKRFVPCVCHSLNLFFNNAASASGEVASVFLIIQQIYVFFSSFPSRWDILKQHVKITLKPVCSTRWQSRISAIIPLRFQLEHIYDALVNIHLDENRDNQTKHEAQSLAKKVSRFKFICSLIVWYNILSKINIVSKIMQSLNLNLLNCNNALKEVLVFLNKYFQDETFVIVVDEAKKIAKILMIDSKFPDVSTIRIRKKKGHFDYESNDLPIIGSQQNYKVNFFFYILDTAINSIDERFEQLELHVEKFQVLYNIYKLKSENKTNILKNCMDLHLLLADTDNRDIDGLELVKKL
ncbi:uncharacterized protein LOC136072375 [Hydra vulgaris]|uniref:uncharacterized protein LOC136072375 n=1 Tax=Hydra vulgaris TaxID=6087 RepID=UPI0032EA348F